MRQNRSANTPSRRASVPGPFAAWVNEAVRPRLLILRLLPTGGFGPVTRLAVLNLVLGLLPVAFVLVTSVMIGGVPAAVDAGLGTQAWDRLVQLFLLAAGLFLFNQTLTPVQAAFGQRLRRRVDSALRDEAMAVMLRPVGIGALEDQRALEELSEVTRYFERDWGTPGQACAGTLTLIARYSRLIVLCILVGIAVAWPAALATGAATMGFRYVQRGGLRKYARVTRQVVGLHREADYLREVTGSAAAAKEIRVFGLTDWLAERFHAAGLAALEPVSKARRRAYLGPYLALTVVGLALGGFALAQTALLAATGDIGLASLAFGMQSIVTAMLLGVYYPEADTSTQYATHSLVALQQLRERFAELEPAEVVRIEIASVPAGTPLTSLQFDGITFRYPGAHTPVLDGVHLELPAGQSTALVGLNGAGKTTLVKLLTRLYEPAGGSIRADGTDIAAFAPVAWRRQVSVVFQDFVRYELTAAENIAAGAAHVPHDPVAVLRAAERAGIADALLALPLGLDTPLTRAAPGGTDLSGGQWQRIAIARALYAVEAGAHVLVLDEPTAALDVRAETAFFDQFVELTRGVTSLLISHRFSSVRRADHIVVLDGGTVVERGSHAELIAADGHYARLFALQAARFACGLDAEGQDAGPDAAKVGAEAAR